ncbi:DUF6789 family protein [Bdellovibrio reynosensis]|uniref:DUF1440 domain-containing protein n=1 Tax=Bdellovibrio reynosensis TaxID=2835041 RepID=A0ABY4CC12_9BACT|nr:DUF6789 family protein [Bdellovibrio reynosensis]UOF02512.1 DUF1440 domain-containing protein [Bdellovibrio reynosensis]
MNTILRGIWASVMATGSMTLTLFGYFKKLPFLQKAPLPPALLSEDVVAKTGISKFLNSQKQQQVTMVSHFGYGAAAGVVYAFLAEKIPGSNPLVKGAAFGLAVWAASYYGLIPGLGLASAGARMTKQRNLMMAVSHVVWGSSLAFAEQELRHRGKDMLDGRQHPLRAH